MSGMGFGHEFDDDNEVDDFEQDFRDTPGDDTPMDIESGLMGANNAQELPIEQKLQLAERANEIYRQQLKYMQDHLQSLRSLIQDKESIIENLMLRYDLGILQQDPSRSSSQFGVDEIDNEELRRKAEGLAQRTILENFELRELVNELRDENFHLRNEIYELQDKINRQALHISKMSKAEAQAQQSQVRTMAQEVNSANGGGQWANDYDGQAGQHPEANTAEAQAKRAAREEKKHSRRQSSIAAPKDFFGPGDDDEDEDADDESEEDQMPRKKKPSEADYMDDEAREKRKKRADHSRKESEAPPRDMFKSADEDEDDDESSEEDAAYDEDDDPAGKKRRGSKQLDEHPEKYSEDAIAKRQARAEKRAHRRNQSSMAAPKDFFKDDPSQTDEAKAIRAKRTHRKNKSSVQMPFGFFGNDDDSDQDEKSRDRKRKHARKVSLMKAVGDKGHLSDEDKEKPARVDNMTRMAERKKGRRPSMSGGVNAAAASGHTKDSSQPVIDLGFDDPLDKVRADELEGQVRDLQEKLEKTAKELEGSQTHNAQLQREIEAVANAANQKRNGEMDSMKTQMSAMTNQLKQLERDVQKRDKEFEFMGKSKLKLVELSRREIDRLTRVINALLKIEKCEEITRILLRESFKRD